LLQLPVIISFIILLFLPINSAFSQNSRFIGLPIIYNYPPIMYGFHSQNWGAVQDARGLIYFANSDGILEYDGVKWRLIRLPNGVTCRALYLAPDGIVYVAGFNEIGYISYTQTGNAEYTSLKSKMTGKEKDFLDVWSIAWFNGKVYFSTYVEIFSWDGKLLNTFNAKRSISSLANANGKLIVAFSDGNPEIFDGTKLIPFITNNILSNAERITLCPKSDGGLFLFTKNGAMYEVINGKVSAVRDDLPILKNGGSVYDVKQLSNGLIALATVTMGVIIIDEEGTIIQSLNEETGLGNNVAYSIYEDRQKNLWITLEEGLARININSPISIFDRRFKLFGALADVSVFNNRLFVSSTFGVFSINFSGIASDYIFERHNVDLDESWSFFHHKDQLYITSSTGLYKIEGNEEIRLTDKYCFMALSPGDSTDIVLLASDDGLNVVRLDPAGNRVIQSIKVAGITGEIRNITELAKGDFWLEISPHTLARVRFTNGYFEKPEVFWYKYESGKIGNAIATLNPKGVPIVVTTSGLLKFDPAGGAFTQLKSKLTLRARDPYSSPLVTNYCPDTLIVFLEGSIYSIQIFPEKDSSLITRIGRINAFNVYKIYADKKLDENSLWLATSTGLLKFDLSKRETQSEIKTFVRSVMIGDSAWFSGVSTGKELLKLSPGSSITINFSALSFEDESSVLYQTYMEGIDTSWQQLNKNSFREFASLSPGNYKFRVRSILPSGFTTPDEVFHFKIRNYWYANNYAYFLYFLILFAIVIVIIKTRTSLLVMERDSLEKLVNERTGKLLSLNTELSSKNQQLINTNLQLEQLDREKSEYLGIVAHDLKNPLSGVLGFAEIISDEVNELETEEITRYAENIRISSTSMLDIINKLLNIDRMEQGKLDVVLHDFDLINLIEETIESNLPHSKRKGINIHFNAPGEKLYINSDRNLVYQIIDNLISNAVKYSYSNSTVNIRFTEEEDTVLLEVEDRGVGIPADEIKNLFKKFSKLSSRPTAGESSTGLGLSIVYMLLKLLGGNISCSSKQGFGSTFKLTLPKRN